MTCDPPWREVMQRAQTRDPERLTHLVLALAARPPLARRMIDFLRARPAVFRRLLGVNCGAYGFEAISVRELLFA